MRVFGTASELCPQLESILRGPGSERVIVGRLGVSPVVSASASSSASSTAVALYYDLLERLKQRVTVEHFVLSPYYHTRTSKFRVATLSSCTAQGVVYRWDGEPCTIKQEPRTKDCRGDLRRWKLSYCVAQWDSVRRFFHPVHYSLTRGVLHLCNQRDRNTHSVLESFVTEPSDARLLTAQFHRAINASSTYTSPSVEARLAPVSSTPTNGAVGTHTCMLTPLSPHTQ